MKKKARSDQALKDVIREEKNRGKSRRPKDTDSENQQRELEQTWLDVLMECGSENVVQSLLISAGLQEGSERFQAAIAAWREIQRKGV